MLIETLLNNCEQKYDGSDTKFLVILCQCLRDTVISEIYILRTYTMKEVLIIYQLLSKQIF